MEPGLRFLIETFGETFDEKREANPEAGLNRAGPIRVSIKVASKACGWKWNRECVP